MARFEVEFLRTNVTVGQFLSYVRAQLRKRGLDELANGIDYDNFVSGDWCCKVDHKERNDEAYVSLGVEYEEVKDMPYDKKSYQRKANGAISNEIVEFIFDDEKTGRGYYYAVEDEVESVESTADETTVAESESVESVENDVCNASENATTNEQNGDAENPSTAREGYKMSERITTARGSFRIVSQSEEELEAMGYGYYCDAGDGEHIIMGNGTRALAVRIQPEPAAEPETNTTATDTAESEAEAEAESESVKSVESVDDIENDVCNAGEHAVTSEQNGDAGNPTTARGGHIMNAFEALRWANITKGFKAIPLHGVNADAKITAALEAVQGKCKVRTIDSGDIKNAIAQMESFFGIPKCKLDGLRVDCDVNAQSFPNAYRFVKWYITSIRRSPTYAPTRAVQVCHMPEAMEEAIIERHTEFSI